MLDAAREYLGKMQAMARIILMWVSREGQGEGWVFRDSRRSTRSCGRVWNHIQGQDESVCPHAAGTRTRVLWTRTLAGSWTLNHRRFDGLQQGVPRLLKWRLLTHIDERSADFMGSDTSDPRKVMALFACLKAEDRDSGAGIISKLVV